MIRPIRFFLILGLFFLPAFPIFAVPQIGTTYDYYDIEGRREKDLRREMHRKSGESYDAHTDWRVKWNYEYKELGGRCVVHQITTSVEIQYRLPRWTNREGAGADLVRKWDAFYEALQRHEKGHSDIGRQAAEQIEAAIPKLSGTVACKDFNEKANAEADRILNIYRKKELDYDLDTGHGRVQGATFP